MGPRARVHAADQVGNDRSFNVVRCLLAKDGDPIIISRPMRTIVITVSLLIASNVFMTFAWYAHLRNLSSRPWYVAAFVSWGIALFEYMLQVPANRTGFHQLS